MLAVSAPERQSVGEMDNEPSDIDQPPNRKRNRVMATATADAMTAHISPPILPSPGDIKLRAEATAAAAATHADAVDREARFPCEAFAAARAERLLSLLVPVELGGEGASVSDAVDVCYVLGRACASTGMVFAMHQIMVVSWCATPAAAPGIAGCCGA
jgi:alkylation response protein AidB-like acyl-CoA dehydrogenase